MIKYGQTKTDWHWVLACGAVVWCVMLAVWWCGQPKRLIADDKAPGLSPAREVGAKGKSRQRGESLNYRFIQGRGVPVGHVEGQPGDYLPNTNDGVFAGVKMTPRSGPSKVNSHSQMTSKIIFGRTGLAAGIGDVYFYSSGYWMGNGALRVGSGEPPISDGRRVFTHSWIGSAMPVAANVLRRIDYLVDTEDVQMVVGLNNGAKSSVPFLLGSAYNVIAVGTASGNSSGGYTVYEGKGRCKPDVVARRNTTSAATPAVAATVARLLEAADRMYGVPDAGRSEVIKAVLMAGASKSRKWRAKAGKPLDEHLGAGVVRFSYSYAVLRAGPTVQGAELEDYGWDFQSLEPGGTWVYELNLQQAMGEVSVVLVWNRRIDGRQVEDLVTGKSRWLDTPRLADFDLKWSVTDGQERGQVLSESASKVDNVEHVYLKQVPSGRHRLIVTRADERDEAWDFAIAWRIEARPRDDEN